MVRIERYAPKASIVIFRRMSAAIANNLCAEVFAPQHHAGRIACVINRYTSARDRPSQPQRMLATERLQGESYVFRHKSAHDQSWRIDKLIPYARKARIHSDTQVAQIAASISEFGFNSPVLVEPEGDIIAGHGRLLRCPQAWDVRSARNRAASPHACADSKRFGSPITSSLSMPRGTSKC